MCSLPVGLLTLVSFHPILGPQLPCFLSTCHRAHASSRSLGLTSPHVAPHFLVCNPYLRDPSPDCRVARAHVFQGQANAWAHTISSHTPLAKTFSLFSLYNVVFFLWSLDNKILFLLLCCGKEGFIYPSSSWDNRASEKWHGDCQEGQRTPIHSLQWLLPPD